MPDVPSDPWLIGALRAGSGAAYDVLVDRHRHAAHLVAAELDAERAGRIVDLASQSVLTAMLDGGGPEVAFRPYFLAAVVGTHAGGPARPFVAPHDPVDIWRDGSPAGTAMTRLDERDRLLLWHLDVEGERPAQVGPLLGVPTSEVPGLLQRARQAMYDVHPGVPLAAPIGPVILGAAARGLDGRTPFMRRSFGSVARVPAARTAAAVTAVVLIGAGAAAAFGAVPLRPAAPAGTAVVAPTVPIIAAPSASPSAPATAQAGSDVVGSEGSPGATGSASATASPGKKSGSSKPPSFAIGTPSASPSDSPSASGSADVGIAARPGAGSVTWSVSGLTAGTSTVVTIASVAGMTLQPVGDDCTGGGSERMTCTVTAGAPGGSFTVSDPTALGGEVSLSVQPVSGLADPDPSNNDATVTP